MESTERYRLACYMMSFLHRLAWSRSCRLPASVSSGWWLARGLVCCDPQADSERKCRRLKPALEMIRKTRKQMCAFWKQDLRSISSAFQPVLASFETRLLLYARWASRLPRVRWQDRATFSWVKLRHFNLYRDESGSSSFQVDLPFGIFVESPPAPTAPSPWLMSLGWRTTASPLRIWTLACVVERCILM